MEQIFIEENVYPGDPEVAKFCEKFGFEEHTKEMDESSSGQYEAGYWLQVDSTLYCLEQSYPCEADRGGFHYTPFNFLLPTQVCYWLLNDQEVSVVYNPYSKKQTKIDFYDPKHSGMQRFKNLRQAVFFCLGF